MTVMKHASVMFIKPMLQSHHTHTHTHTHKLSDYGRVDKWSLAEAIKSRHTHLLSSTLDHVCNDTNGGSRLDFSTMLESNQEL